MGSELWDAASHGNTDQVRELLARSENINIDFKNRDWNDWTPLHVASSVGYLSCVQLLLEKGADINCTSTLGSTPLLLASSNNRPAVVSALIAAGAQIDRADNHSWTPLIVAVECDRFAVVKILLEAGANRDLKIFGIYGNTDGKTALDVAIIKNMRGVADIIKEYELMELLVLPEVVACSGCALPAEISDLCGDFIFMTPFRRELEKRRVIL